LRICAVSVDVEEEPCGPEQESRAARTFRGVENLDKMLEVFSEFRFRASLFATGEVLEKYPQLVERWAVRHEIGCHGGYYHKLLDNLADAERRRQLEKYCELHGKVLGGTPKGFRAVMNSIDDAQFGLLEEFDFIYDSSVIPRFVPFRNYVGYKGKAPAQPYHPSHDNYREEGERRILEIPESPLMLGIPLNGTWLRMFSPNLYRVLLALKKPRFIGLSMHAWDVVEHQSSYSHSTGDRFVRYLESILKTLSEDYEFMPAEQIASLTIEDRQG